MTVPTGSPARAAPAGLRPTHAIGLLFVANGLTLSALWPRFPQVKDAVGAEAATFGLALLGTGVGGIVGSALAPLAVRWLGARRAAIVSAVVLAATTVLVGLAGSVPALFGAFAVMGLMDGVADITQNHLMFEAQRTSHRSLVSRMHALWSVGALAGTAGGTVAAALAVSVLTQIVAFAVVGVCLVGTAARGVSRLAPSRALPAPAADPSARPRPGARGRASRWGAVVVAALAVSAVEGVANEWSALTLRDGLGATAAMAGAGPTAFVGAMLAGRLAGDRIIDRLGLESTARLGAWVVGLGSGLGLAVAVVLDQPIVLVAGLVVAGVGAATLFPAMLAAGDRLDATGAGVAVGSSAARAGFLAVPVIVGTVGDVAGLPVGFALLPLAGLLAVVVLPRALRPPVAH